MCEQCANSKKTTENSNMFKGLCNMSEHFETRSKGNPPNFDIYTFHASITYLFTVGVV